MNNEQLKAMLESYARNLLGSLVGAITIVMNTSNQSLLNFGSGEWILVANALWASIIPTALRWVNKKDPAFGLIAGAIAKDVEAALKNVKPVKKAAKKPAKKTSKVVK